MDNSAIIQHQTYKMDGDERALLPLIESLRENGLLGESASQYGGPDEFLLLSGGPLSERSRWSILGGPPQTRVVARQPMVRDSRRTSTDPLRSGEVILTEPEHPLVLEVEGWKGGVWKKIGTYEGLHLAEAFRKLEALIPSLPRLDAQLARLPILPGTLLGLLAYDLIQWTQPIRLKHTPPTNSLLAHFAIGGRLLVHDKKENTLHLLTWENDPWFDYTAKLLESEIPSIILVEPKPSITGSPIVESNITDQKHEEKVREVQEGIRLGNLYQLNYGREWTAPLEIPPWDVMKRVAWYNPAPLSGWFFSPFENITLVSSSPEVLLKQEGGDISTSPIKGTRPRGKNEDEDTILRKEMLESEKEMAEHLMLVDLERNDLGMVSSVGSVEWSSFQVECYPHVQHLVSDVRGTLSDSKDGWDALEAMFPGGSITGCPKTITAASIDEMEKKARRFWTGSLGYIDHRREVAGWNILIRTLEVKGSLEEGYNGRLMAGGGLVIGSKPSQEVEETKWKSKGLGMAAGWYPQPEVAISGLNRNEITTHKLKTLAPNPLFSNQMMLEPVVWNKDLALSLPAHNRLLLVDNLDSFTWNIVHAFSHIGVEVVVVFGRGDMLDYESLLTSIKPTHLLLGPGPGRPESSSLTTAFAEAALRGALLRSDSTPLPVIGVCLGHQAIGVADGWDLVEAQEGPLHGVPVDISSIYNEGVDDTDGGGRMVRYNSLELSGSGEKMIVTSVQGGGGGVMSIAHPELPIIGVQYHPESGGSERGDELFRHFISL